MLALIELAMSSHLVHTHRTYNFRHSFLETLPMPRSLPPPSSHLLNCSPSASDNTGCGWGHVQQQQQRAAVCSTGFPPVMHLRAATNRPCLVRDSDISSSGPAVCGRAAAACEEKPTAVQQLSMSAPRHVITGNLQLQRCHPSRILHDGSGPSPSNVLKSRNTNVPAKISAITTRMALPQQQELDEDIFSLDDVSTRCKSTGGSGDAWTATRQQGKYDDAVRGEEKDDLGKCPPSLGCCGSHGAQQRIADPRRSLDVVFECRCETNHEEWKCYRLRGAIPVVTGEGGRLTMESPLRAAGVRCDALALHHSVSGRGSLHRHVATSAAVPMPSDDGEELTVEALRDLLGIQDSGTWSNHRAEHDRQQGEPGDDGASRSSDDGDHDDDNERGAAFAVSKHRVREPVLHSVHDAAEFVIPVCELNLPDGPMRSLWQQRCDGGRRMSFLRALELLSSIPPPPAASVMMDRSSSAIARDQEAVLQQLRMQPQAAADALQLLNSYRLTAAAQRLENCVHATLLDIGTSLQRHAGTDGALASAVARLRQLAVLDGLRPLSMAVTAGFTAALQSFTDRFLFGAYTDTVVGNLLGGAATTGSKSSVMRQSSWVRQVGPTWATTDSRQMVPDLEALLSIAPFLFRQALLEEREFMTAIDRGCNQLLRWRQTLLSLCSIMAVEPQPLSTAIHDDEDTQASQPLEMLTIISEQAQFAFVSRTLLMIGAFVHWSRNSWRSTHRAAAAVQILVDHGLVSAPNRHRRNHESTAASYASSFGSSFHESGGNHHVSAVDGGDSTPMMSWNDDCDEGCNGRSPTGFVRDATNGVVVDRAIARNVHDAASCLVNLAKRRLRCGRSVLGARSSYPLSGTVSTNWTPSMSMATSQEPLSSTAFSQNAPLTSEKGGASVAGPSRDDVEGYRRTLRRLLSPDQ